MKCPNCKDKEMDPIYTQQGVEVDFCSTCKGIWLDKGEIFYFTKKSDQIRRELAEAVKYGQPTEKQCPRTGKQMQEIALLKGQLKLDYSPSSGGIWFDEEELNKLQTYFNKEFRLGFDKPNLKPKITEKVSPPLATTLLPLPNLVLRSFATMTILYGFVVLILITLTLYTDLTPTLALVIGICFAAFQFLLGPFIMDISLRWFYTMEWASYERLPSHLRSFIIETCRKKNMKNPRFGIIHDGAPNAFTYGHTPNNARIVITSGLMQLLNEDEVKGVVAHEIGHAKHWDMLLMTAAQLVPLILYYIFRTMMPRGGGSDKRKGPAVLIAIASYILYIISEYIVLWFSRTREYFADKFAAKETNNPNSLASALVKIGYGLAGKESMKAKEGKKQGRSEGLNAIGALGIFDPKSALAMVAGSVQSVSGAKRMGDEIDKDNLKGAMKWDIWNPWALYYELHSTHPLIANRIRHLSRHSEVLGKEPYIRFDLVKPESYWDEFFLDVFIKVLPSLVFIGLIIYSIVSFFSTQTLNMPTIGLGFIVIGAASLLKTKFTYRTRFFPDMTIASLLKKVKVSGIRPVPCKLSGTIIGRGIPGLIWSEDFVMQDDTGIMFLDYRQPIPLWDFFFGLLKRSRYKNQPSEVTGWFKRAPIPFVELKSIRAKGEKERRCYTWIAKYIAAFIPIIAGMVLLFINT